MPPKIGAVASTIDLLNGSTLPGNYPVTSCSNPAESVAVPSRNEIFLACGDIYFQGQVGGALDPNIDRVVVLNATTGGLVASIPVMGDLGMGYDPLHEKVFVGGWSGYSVLSTSSNRLIANQPWGSCGSPEGFAFDAATGNMWVSCFGSANLLEISGTNNTVLDNVGLKYPYYPLGLALDSANGNLFATIPNFNRTMVISTVTDKIVATINLPPGLSPNGIAYDSQDQQVYFCAFTRWGQSEVDVVNGTTDAIVQTIHISGAPDSVTYDSANGDLYIANWGTNILTVISGANDSILANITVGTEPGGPVNAVSYDPVTGDIYVPNSQSDTISVISGSSQTVVTSYQTAETPLAMAYEPANGDIYVASFWNVTVISGSNHDVITNIPLGISRNGTRLSPNQEAGIAYDPSNQYLYVTSPLTPIVSVISGNLNTVVAQIATRAGGPSSPQGIVYDASNGDLYISLHGANSVEVFSAANYTFLSTIGVGQGPQGIDYDSLSGNVYVTNSVSNTISVIDTKTDTVIAQTPVGQEPSSLCLDPALGSLVVTNHGGDNVTFLDPSNNSVSGSVGVGILGTTNNPPFSLPAAADYDAHNGTVYVADYGNANVSVLLGNESAGQVPVGTEPTAILYDPASGEVYVANFADSSIAIINTSLPEIPELSGVDVSPTQPIMSIGTSQAFTATPLCYLQTCPSSLTYLWSDGNSTLGTLNSTSGSSVTFSATSVGSLWVSVEVYLDGILADWSVPVIILNRITSVSVNPSTASLYPAGTQVFSSTLACTGGTCPDGASYSWSLNDSLGTLNSTFWPSVNFSAGPTAGVVTLTVNVSLNGVSAHAASTIVISGPTISSFTAYPSNFSLGGTTYLNVTVSGGKSPYTYSYAGLPTGCMSSSTSSLACTPTATGASTVMVTVTDSNSLAATKSVSFTVLNAGGLYVKSFTVSQSSIQLGGTVHFNATASGGTTPYTYAYSKLPTGCTSSNTASLSCTPSAAGTYAEIIVTVTDSKGATATSNPATLTVTTSTVTITSVAVNPTTPTVISGAAQQFTASPTCSAACPPSVTYAWTLSANSLGSLSSSTGSATTFTAGSKTGTVTLTLSATLGKVTKWANATITITAKSSPTGFLGLSGDTGYILIGVVGAVVAAAVALLALQGRKGPPTSPAKEEPKGEEKDSTPAGSEKTDGKPDTKPEK